ncbi:magnesium transporter CorA family protein [Bombilactobacillus thymidiniphilus]|uniref:Magnesium transporter CorA family protein n=1 Tax=Bombilactobacillus thymidiniphilus TaxID=2923363 RepID=A0ABY4PDH1_9LACO|nr:magnesium transporter CorA family protein [Bombilactobacillus thymidiniphilus]UQS83572.1 magnesium transporter CorA family protein [Bombilactobacillus thymidiniphilus]
MIRSYQTRFHTRIINANNITPTEQDQLMSEYGVTREIINYALDKFERPRVTYNSLTHSYLMVLSLPSAAQGLANSIQSVTLLANEQDLICFTNSYSEDVMAYIDHFLTLYKDKTNLIFRIFADLIATISDNFLDEVKKHYNEQEKIEMRFQHRSHRTQTIGRLAQLQTNITFGVTSTSGNDDLVDEIYNFFDSDDNDLNLDNRTRRHLENARIESNQALKNFQLINDIAQQLSVTYNNILNNETNDVMRYLTVYSLILTIPTIVVGFYGMNMKLPLANSGWSWIFSIGITAILCIILILDMIRRHFL